MKISTLTQLPFVNQAIILLVLFLNTSSQVQAQFATDVGIINVTSPITGVADCDINMDSVKVTLFNFGTTPQSLIPFRFSINGSDAGVVQPQDGFYTGVLGPDSMVTIAFEITYDFSEDGIYEIAAWTEVETDMDLTNDTLITYVENITLVSTFPYNNNFLEIYPTGWYPDISQALAQNGTWEYGKPEGLLLDTAFVGEYSYVTNLTGNHNNNELSYLISPCMDFTNFAEDPIFSCAINFDTETNFDGAWLEGTIDDGITWTKIGSVGSGINWYTNSVGAIGDVWAGDSEGWIIAEHIIEGFAGEPMVRLRFGFDSDGSVTNEGVAIDAISIVGCLQSFNNEFDITNATTDTTANGTITIIPGEGVSPFTYSWSNGETTATITDLLAGEYDLTIVDALGCSEEVTVTVAVGIEVSTNELEDLVTLNLFPNPTNGLTTLELEFDLPVDFTVSLINSIGQEVLQFSQTKVSNGKYPIDLTAFPSGLYFVKINVNGSVSRTERLLVL